MESNHRFLGVDQASLPLDHGAVLLKWSHRESHSDFWLAEPASSCWTMTPNAEAVGLEPTSGCSPPPVFKTGSSSGRMTSVAVYQKLRRLESNQHEDVQSVSSYR